MGTFDRLSVRLIRDAIFQLSRAANRRLTNCCRRIFGRRCQNVQGQRRKGLGMRIFRATTTFLFSPHLTAFNPQCRQAGTSFLLLRPFLPFINDEWTGACVLHNSNQHYSCFSAPRPPQTEPYRFRRLFPHRQLNFFKYLQIFLPTQSNFNSFSWVLCSCVGDISFCNTHWVLPAINKIQKTVFFCETWTHKTETLSCKQENGSANPGITKCTRFAYKLLPE